MVVSKNKNKKMFFITENGDYLNIHNICSGHSYYGRITLYFGQEEYVGYELNKNESEQFLTFIEDNGYMCSTKNTAGIFWKIDKTDFVNINTISSIIGKTIRLFKYKQTVEPKKLSDVVELKKYLKDNNYA